MFFNFDKINNSNPIRLGIDFKFKLTANGRSFHFWLNSDSIRNYELPENYSYNFDIPD